MIDGDRIFGAWCPLPAQAFIKPDDDQPTVGEVVNGDSKWRPIDVDYAALRHIMDLTPPMGQGRTEWVDTDIFNGILPPRLVAHDQIRVMLEIAPGQLVVYECASDAMDTLLVEAQFPNLAAQIVYARAGFISGRIPPMGRGRSDWIGHVSVHAPQPRVVAYDEIRVVVEISSDQFIIYERASDAMSLAALATQFPELAAQVSIQIT